MRRFSVRWMVILALAVCLGLPGGAWGANFNYAGFRGEWGLRFGYGKSLRKASVQLYSVLPRWGIYFLRPGHKLGRLGLAFVLEGIISVANAEDTGAEVGITPMLKATYLLTPWAIFFLEGGAGVISESFSSPALAHAFNFTPQVGGGLDFAVTSRLGLSVAYRFRHSSNAGLYKENPAFDVSFFHAGLTYYY